MKRVAGGLYEESVKILGGFGTEEVLSRLWGRMTVISATGTRMPLRAPTTTSYRAWRVAPAMTAATIHPGRHSRDQWVRTVSAPDSAQGLGDRCIPAQRHAIVSRKLRKSSHTPPTMNECNKTTDTL